MEPETSETGTLEYIKSHSDVVMEHVSEYSYLVADSLSFILVGTLFVFLLHKLAARFLFRYVANGRLLRVIFGTLYFLVLVVTILLVLKQIGLEVGAVGSIAILVVLVAAVLVYFLIPFLPKLPFVPGHMIETNGVMGTVDTVSTFHTMIRKFDGTVVFLPNALVMASRILNYSYTPSRRIEMTITVSADSDLAETQNRLVQIVSEDERVLDEPSAPAVFAMNADAIGVQMTIYCWVKNEDFLGARSDLWLKLVQACEAGNGITLSLPKQEVFVRESATPALSV